MISWLVVDIESLRLIRDVAHSRSVSKAAQASGISQSAASQQIGELEKTIGMPLFDRRTRPLSVTAAGKLYAEYCRDVLRRSDELSASLARLKGEIDGTVRVAAIYSIGLSDMDQIERHFNERFPSANLLVAYLRPERVYQAVERDEADLGLLSYAESSRALVALPWRDEEMVLAVSPEHRLSSRMAVQASELEGEAFVGFDDDLPIQSHISRFLRERKVMVDPVLHFDNLQMIKEAVAHGAGISIMPRRVMREELHGKRLVAIPFHPAELFRPVAIIHGRRKALNDATRGLLDLLLGR